MCCCRFIAKITEWTVTLLAASGGQAMEKMVEAVDMLLQLVRSIRNMDQWITLDHLLVNMRDQVFSNSVVFFLRLVTSHEIKSREEFFAPFIMVSDVRQKCLGGDGNHTGLFEDASSDRSTFYTITVFLLSCILIFICFPTYPGNVR